MTDISIKASTKKARINAAKAVLKQAYKFGVLPTDITKDVKNIKVSNEHVKDGLTPDEVLTVAAHIDGISNECKQAKLNAMFYLAAFQGLRVNEICTLRIENISLERGQIRIEAKGKHDLTVIDLHEFTINALRQCIACTGQKSGYLFTSKWKGETKQLTTRAAQKTFKNMFDALGIDNSMHGFRHYYITMVLEVLNGDLLAAQKLSRHKSIEVLKVYDDRRNKKAINKKVFEAFTLNFSK